MKKFRKEGSVYLISLFFFLMMFLVFAIFLSLSIMGETYERVQTAAATAAKTRALAVNIPLKEQYGIIETFRPDVSQGYQVNYVEPSYSFSPSPGYDNPVLSPLSQTYQTTLQNADTAAKQAAINSLNDSLGKNEAGDKIVNLQPENICIEVLPLPAGDATTGKGTLNFSCSVTTPTGSTITISANNISVYGYTHPLNNSGKLRVYNVVFVGMVYEDKHMFYNLLQNLINGSDQSTWSPPPIRGVYSIAYPQIDACTTTEC